MQAVSGTVSVDNLPAVQTVGGTVNVGNTPANQNVTVSNFPATQPVAITNIAPAEVADNVFSAARGFEPGSRSFPFGKTINVTTLIVAEGDSGFFDVYLSMPSGDELVLVKDTRDHFSQGFTMPVPATGVRVVCTNVVLTCSINVSAFGY